jgi:hypothetical protein
MATKRDVHGKVQLWEDGPYWATTNIGAKKPEDFGYYFWCGSTSNGSGCIHSPTGKHEK